MKILITEKYKEMNHHILKEKCLVCENQFKVGDSLEFVPIQKSKDNKTFNSLAIVIHTDCYWV